MLLVTLLQNDRQIYWETSKFLGPRILRRDLPNLQDIPYFNYESNIMYNFGTSLPVDQTMDTTAADLDLLQDCAFTNVT